MGKYESKKKLQVWTNGSDSDWLTIDHVTRSDQSQVDIYRSVDMDRSDDADGEGDQCGHEEARVRDERQQANTIRPGIDLNVGI